MVVAAVICLVLAIVIVGLVYELKEVMAPADPFDSIRSETRRTKRQIREETLRRTEQAIKQRRKT
jgi:hypothetical protein